MVVKTKQVTFQTVNLAIMGSSPIDHPNLSSFVPSIKVGRRLTEGIATPV
jgi:hypothetical protein